MKLFKKIFFTIIIIFVLVVGTGIFYINYGLKEGKELKINDVSLANISDGEYQGEYHGGRWSNILNVTIEDHAITHIDIIDDVTFVKPGVSDELFEEVIKKQKIDVDAVASATVTSNAYLKSIENAVSSN